MKRNPINGILCGIIAIITAVIAAWVKTPDFSMKNPLTVFIILFCVERTWENFFTSKEKDRLQYEGDWCLIAVSISFMFVLSLSFAEFFWKKVSINIAISFFGCVIFLGAMALRFWSMKTLGRQWGIHILGANKLQGSLKLIESGPYRHVRHPIYLGAILEAVSVTLVLNTFVSSLVVLVGFVPLEVCRARLEERMMLRRYGQSYADYLVRVPRFLPFSLLKKRTSSSHNS